MKLLVDMNLSPRWVIFLAENGFDATHWSSVGAANAPDTAIMAFAAAHDFVVLTHDLDFGAILAASYGNKPSAVQIRAEDVSPESIGRPLVTALRQMAGDLAEGALLTIDPSRTRLRVLPLRSR